MAYLGRQPAIGRYTKLDDFSSSFNGSLTTFDLTSGGDAQMCGSEAQIIVSLGGIIQEPETDYTVAGTQITFTTAPLSGDDFFAILLGDTLDVGVPSDDVIRNRHVKSDAAIAMSKLDGSSGSLTALTVDDITINGSTISDSGELTIDVGGDIILDADGGDIIFKDGGTTIGTFANNSNNLRIVSNVSDADLILRGVDGGAAINALTLDMSEGGAGLFVAGIGVLGGSVAANIGVNVPNEKYIAWFDSGTSGGTAAYARGVGGALHFGGSSFHFKADVLTNFEGDVLLAHDGAVLKFGANSDVLATHVHNVGLDFSSTRSGADSIFRFKNSANASASDIRLILQTGGTSGGDVMINLDGQATGARFTMGIDTSADKFVIADADKGGFDGSDEVFTIANGGSATFVSDLAVSTTLPTIAGETGTLVIGDSGAIVTFDGETNFSQNVYYNSGWKYRTTDIASILQMGNGDIPFRFSYAASGSADAAVTFTEAMQINGDGHVGIGMAADSTYALKVTNPGGNTYQQIYGPTGYIAELQIQSQNASGALFAKMDNNGVGYFGTNINTDLLFYSNNTERMRLSGAGLLGIGTTSPEALLNVFTASAGTWTAPTNFNDVVIESNTYAGLVIGVPDADEGLIGISSPSTNGAVGYGMLWDYDVGIGRLFTSKVGAKTRIEADNQVTQVTFDGAAGSQFAEFANDIGLKSDNSVIYFGADNDIRLTHVPDSGLSIQGTDAGAGGGPILELYRNSASPADADFLGEIYFYGEDDAGNKQEYASIKSRAVDVSSGSEDGRLELYSSLNGTMKSVFLSNNTGTPEIVINEDSEDINFRVESNSNANMLFVDAGEDRVGIGTNSPSSDLTFGGASGGIHFTDSSKGIYYDGNELVMYTTGADDFVTLNGESYVRFNTNSQEAMRILLNRNVGIGTTAPSTSLHVKNGFMRVQAGNQGSGDFTQAVGIDWSQESDSQVGKIQMVRTAWGHAPHKMEFYVRNTSSSVHNALTLGELGQVGIGGANYGTDGQVLTSQGASLPPQWEAAGGGAWTLIGTQTASNSASLTQTGIDATYATYVIILEDMRPATDGAQAYIRLGDSSGIDSTMGDYEWLGADGTDISGDGTQTTRTFDVDDSDDAIRLMGSGLSVGSGTGEGLACTMYLRNARGSSMYPVVDGRGFGFSTSTVGQELDFWGVRTSMITTDRIQFYFGSGNTTSGRMTVWGIAHA